MPTYEYRCKDCNHTFEVFQSFTDDSLTECPKCAGTLRKVFGNVGITFKGSGFYKTDSRAGSGRGTGKPSKSDDDKSSTNGAAGDSSSAEKSSSDGSSAKGGSGTSSNSSSDSSTPAPASSS